MVRSPLLIVEKNFFFEKKKQKTFTHAASGPLQKGHSSAARNR
jgi:hypothetical protein